MAITPQQVNTAARQRYNAVGDDFWSDEEIYNTIFQACLEFCSACPLEATYSTTSVANQQEYDYPTNVVAIKRITYDGRKLVPYTFREDDVSTILNQATTSTGTPDSYATWNNIIYLRPIPSTAGLTIKIFGYIEPQPVTSGSTLEIPVRYQMSLINPVLAEMAAKNKNYEGFERYRSLWEKDLMRAKKDYRLGKVGDAFQVVKNVDILAQSFMGNI